MTKQEFATLVVAMQAMYGKDFIGTEQALDVWYALLHDLDYQILSKVLQQYMLTNKFKPTVAELREIYTELVSPTISDWSKGWEQVSKAIGHCGMYQGKAAMESFDEITREVVKRLGFQNICLSENIVADRARFAEIYQAIKKRKRTEVNVESALPNLWEMVQKQEIDLTFTEFEILYLLANNPGRVFSKEQIYDIVWKESYTGDYNIVMSHIRNIREKIEDNSSKPIYIQTVWGVGYRFNQKMVK